VYSVDIGSFMCKKADLTNYGISTRLRRGVGEGILHVGMQRFIVFGYLAMNALIGHESQHNITSTFINVETRNYDHVFWFAK